MLGTEAGSGGDSQVITALLCPINRHHIYPLVYRKWLRGFGGTSSLSRILFYEEHLSSTGVKDSHRQDVKRWRLVLLLSL